MHSETLWTWRRLIHTNDGKFPSILLYSQCVVLACWRMNVFCVWRVKPRVCLFTACQRQSTIWSIQSEAVTLIRDAGASSRGSWSDWTQVLYILITTSTHVHCHVVLIVIRQIFVYLYILRNVCLALFKEKLNWTFSVMYQQSWIGQFVYVESGLVVGLCFITHIYFEKDTIFYRCI